MKNGTLATLTVAFLLVALLLLGGFNLSKPRILVLHSSDRTSTTVGKVDEGIRQVLDKNRQPITTHWHYLGIDNLPDEDHRQDAAKGGLRAIEQFNPDVVIAVDDEAQQYVVRRFAGRDRPKLVYTAIDHDPKEYGYVGAANVTGVSEVLPLATLRDVLQYVNQGQPVRLAVLGDTGPTSKGQLQQVQAFGWGPHTVVSAQTLGDFPAWQAAITALEGKVDVVLVLSAVNMVDTTALLALNELNKHMGEQNRRLHLCEVKGPVMDRLKPSRLLGKDLTGQVFLSAAQAYAHLAGQDAA